MLEKSSLTHGESADLNATMFFALTEAFKVWQPVLSAAIEWNGRILEIATSVNKELLEFANRRFEDDVAFQRHLWGCTSFQNVWGICNEYFQKAIKDHQRGFVEMAMVGAGPRANA
jgi:hypothetical protein